MKKTTSNLLIGFGLLALATSHTAFAQGRGNDKPIGTIYVISQGLYYDTFKTTDLPPHGEFQQLYPATEYGPATDFGPGDAGFVGGRWWIDTNSDGVMDELDVYFSCPLLGPGRTEP